MRASGVLLPIASLPSDYGIGCFSKEAYEFADALKLAGQKYWQMLPLGPTGYGDSPYQAFSTFAGNPYYIDLETLIEEGLLTKAEYDAADFGDDDERIDYGKIYKNREGLLRIAYERSHCSEDEDFQNFVINNLDWLQDYALYMAVKHEHNNVSWLEWEEDIRMREDEAVREYSVNLHEDIEFYKYVQYLFFHQWNQLKEYVNRLGIQIIGDIPIYVAMDSADTWAETRQFQFDDRKRPTAQAGVPPDGFSATGQLWGNPLHDWDYQKETGYEWWIRRIRHHLKLYDIIRIDHFRGLDAYYAVAMEAESAENGVWRKGPGMELFDALRKELGNVDIIAEDLGFLTESSIKLVKDSGYPGMKVLQFAFDSREESDYLPHTYKNHCVVYTGTHDNDTLVGWFHTLDKADRQYALDYIGRSELSRNEISWAFIRLAQQSVADTCIIPMQDYLSLGSEARINVPSTLGDNWEWRMTKHMITVPLLRRIKDMTKLYGRLRE